MNERAAAERSIVVAQDADTLLEALHAQPDRVAHQRILKADGFGVVRLAFEAGQSLSEHEAAVPILIQVLRGAVDIEIDGTTQRFAQGGLVYIAPHVRHAVHADQRADLLLTLADVASRVPSDRAGVGETDHSHGHTAQDAAGPGEEAGDEATHKTGDEAGHAPSPEGRSLLAAAACECGDVEGAPFPELDVRSVPHAIRHATVFGALDSLRPWEGLVLVAPHDPRPLLLQIGDRTGDRFEVTYLERGPEAWRLQFVNTGDSAA